MQKPDIIYEVIAAHDDVIYQLRPNPDGPPGSGYRWGAVLSWKNDDDKDFREGIFVTPDALEALSVALAEAAKDAPKKKPPLGE